MQQYALPFALSPSYAPEHFFVSACNKDAYGRITAWPDWPGQALLLCGAPGSGKSHLAHIWMQKSRATLLPNGYNPAQLPAGNLLLEDITHAHEQALLHLYNQCRETGAALLLTASLPPAQLPFTLPDLTSRLLALPLAQLHPPDDTLLAGVLRKQFADRQLKVEEGVIGYISMRMERSLADAQTMVEMIDQCAIAEHKVITVPFVRQFLKKEL